MITILGPTATGKTSLAANVASLIDGEIISADSRQVYRGMDIGTGKDKEDYLVNGIPIPYHLIDIIDPGYEYNVFEFQKDFIHVLNKIISQKKVPVLCGGSGLYIDAVLRRYKLTDVSTNDELRKKLEKHSDEELIALLKQYGQLHNITDTTDRERTIRAIEIAEQQNKPDNPLDGFPDLHSINFGLRFERSVIRERITQRLKVRLEKGMVEEVKALLDKGLLPDQLMFYGLEYKYVTLYITGELTYNKMFNKLNTAIHQFAKRQMTWFRRMEKKDVAIEWIDGELSLEDKAALILKRIGDY